ncbi:hypothetical protein [Natronospora cellulosivora (SeqCode)]
MALRIGVIFHAIYFFLILILRNNTADFLIPLGSSLGITAIYLHISLITILIFTLINSFFAPFFNVPFNAATYNVLDKTGKSEQRIEFIIYKELALNTGRILGIIAFIFLAHSPEAQANLRYILLLIASVQLVVPLLIKNINSEGKII